MPSDKEGEQYSLETAPQEDEPLNLTNMLKSDIQDILDERGIEWSTSMTKAELIELAEGGQ